MSVTRLEPISDIPTIEWTYEGGIFESSFDGWAWRDNACGLVWTRKSQAAGCPQRKHVRRYVDTYYHQYVIDGRPQIVETCFERLAIRKEQPGASKGDPPIIVWGAPPVLGVAPPERTPSPPAAPPIVRGEEEDDPPIRQRRSRRID